MSGQPVKKVYKPGSPGYKRGKWGTTLTTIKKGIKAGLMTRAFVRNEGILA